MDNIRNHINKHDPNAIRDNAITLTDKFHVAVRLFSNILITDDIKMWQEQTTGSRGDGRVCHRCSYHIFTSSVIYHLLKGHTATWNRPFSISYVNFQLANQPCLLPLYALMSGIIEPLT